MLILAQLGRECSLGGLLEQSEPLSPLRHQAGGIKVKSPILGVLSSALEMALEIGPMKATFQKPVRLASSFCCVFNCGR